MKKILILIIILSACSTSSIKPEINLVNLNVGNSTLLETNLNTKIRITNPSNKEILVNGSSHNLFIQGVKVGRALNNKEFTIPALGEIEQDLNFRVSNLSFLTNIQSLMNKPDFDYKIDSTFYTNKSFSLGTIKTSSEKSFKLN